MGAVSLHTLLYKEILCRFAILQFYRNVNLHGLKIDGYKVACNSINLSFYFKNSRKSVQLVLIMRAHNKIIDYRALIVQ